MKKRKKPAQIVSGWTKFVQTHPVFDPVIAEQYEDYSAQFAEFASGESTMWQNNRYVVIRKEIGEGMTWLSIRHRNRKAVRDWRHFQRIKNELAGPEREAVEIYPAESRLVDEANQYHLWVFPENYTIPFGFNERLVGEINIGASKQRPFEEAS